MPTTYKTLRLILGDQLNTKHSWFSNTDKDTLYVLMEIKPESEYVRHHIQKITAIFAAMRSFRDTLEKNGHDVHYLSITDTENAQSFETNIRSLIDEYKVREFQYMEPDEYRLDALLAEMCSNLDVQTAMVSSEHFLTTRAEVADFFGNKSLLMENFYRYMREKHNILMENGEPTTGKWNYDHENRKKLPRDHDVPEPKLFANDVSEVLNDINEAGLPHFGRIDAENFIWAIDREQALDNLEYFLHDLFEDFGKYQDALTETSWSVYHSRISQAMNLKLISPLEVINAAVDAWENSDAINIAQAEGFVRQILGWREYMRGIYWKYMPDYAKENFFEHARPLPDWFWTAETDMRCLNRAIDQSLEYAYAHHIQRLMVTGNFALLAGISPAEVDEWYLGIYIDAFEWVEITNTRGMSQFADGGIVGSKPYVSSANYIHKMGDHCKACKYDHKKKTGEDACPFNSMYWHFLDRHRSKLENNPRMSMMYRVWDKNDDQQAILDQAETYLTKINQL